jgi:hypothetical protein
MIVPVEATIEPVMDMPGHWIAVADDMPHIIGVGHDEDEATADLMQQLMQIPFH